MIPFMKKSKNKPYGLPIDKPTTGFITHHKTLKEILILELDIQYKGSNSNLEPEHTLPHNLHNLHNCYLRLAWFKVFSISV